MRVLITTPWYPSPEVPIRGIWTIGHAHAIAQLHDVVMLPFSPRQGTHGAYTLDDRVDDGIRTLEVAYPPPKVPGLGLVAVRKATREVLRRLAGEGFVPDVVHAHVFLSAPAALTAKRAASAALVVNEHLSRVTDWRLSRMERALARYVYARADLVCTTAERQHARVRQLGAKHTRRVFDTIDTARFRPGNRVRPPDEVRAIAAGSLDEKKGHRYLLEAVARARSDVPGLVLDIAGDGELRADLEAQARSLRIDDRVRFHGYVTPERLADMMRGADVHVLPSLRESQPHVVGEAIASGLPTVATNVGSTAEMLAAGGGTVVPPADAEALADALVEVCSDLDAFDPQVLANHARERYGPEASARMWTQIYTGLLQKSPPESGT